MGQNGGRPDPNGVRADDGCGSPTRAERPKMLSSGPPADHITALGQAIVVARQRIESRDPAGALMYLVDALQGVLCGAGARPLGAAELIIAEQMADLASLLGEWPAADSLLRAIEATARNSHALEGADYACLKRAHMHMLRGDLDTAREVLASLAPRIGELDSIEFTSSGLIAWERVIAWRGLTHSAELMLLSRVDLVFALVLIDLGQYPRRRRGHCARAHRHRRRRDG